MATRPQLTSLGARRVFAFATHGLFTGNAADRIEASSLEEVVVANTIPLNPAVLRDTRKVCASLTSSTAPALPRTCIIDLALSILLAARRWEFKSLLCIPHQVRQVSVGKLLARAINCIHTGDSVYKHVIQHVYDRWLHEFLLHATANHAYCAGEPTLRSVSRGCLVSLVALNACLPHISYTRQLLKALL